MQGKTAVAALDGLATDQLLLKAPLFQLSAFFFFTQLMYGSLAKMCVRVFPSRISSSL